jgi:TIGR03009 family protein
MGRFARGWLAISVVFIAISTSRPGGAQPSSPQRQPVDRVSGAPPAAARRTPPTARDSQRVAAQPRQLSAPAPALADAAAPLAGPPKEFVLSPEQQQRVDQILTYWEHHTAKIKTHECNFRRDNFDSVFGTADVPRTIDFGTIRYMHPDKGLFRVDRTYDVNAQASDPKQKYVQQQVQFGEYWMCDGESIYQFDARTKVLTESKLPPHLRGKAITEGPLPFLFGAKADDMKARYWIREITPQDNPKGEYWLEVLPKRREDAANFDRLLVQLKVDKGQLLPHGLKVINPQGHIIYVFSEHAANNTMDRVQGFLDAFVRPSTPAGWTKVVEDWNGAPMADRQAAPAESAEHPKRR